MTPNRRQVLMTAGSALFCSAFSTIGRASASDVQIISGPAFGTTWRAVLPATADKALVTRIITDAIQLVDNAMSPFNTASELSLFNAHKETSWMLMSEPVCDVVGESLYVSQLTDGAFDPTVGPMVNRFGFGPIKSTDPAAFKVDYKNVTVGEGRIYKSRPEVTLDLCGIAKGYALDLMVAGTRSEGEHAFLIELGGEVFAAGQHPSGRNWHTGIEQPGAQTTALQRIISLDGHAVATSGPLQNGYAESGRTVSHIIDPRTAKPVVNSILSVSVVAPTASRADALATAFAVMGPDAGMALARREKIAALFLLRDDVVVREIMTGPFENFVLI